METKDNMTKDRIDRIVVHRENRDFVANINNKDIKMSFEELNILNTLLHAVLDEYTNTTIAAYIDKQGKIITF